MVPLTPVYAEEQEQRRIDAIKISGNQRTEAATIVSFLGLKEGDVVTETRINEALTKVFATKLFADIKIRFKGNTLLVEVEENPVISKIAFEGNKRINDETLQAEIKLRPRSTYNKTDLQKDVKRVINIYQKSGRFSVTVEPQVIQLEQNRVNLVFKIDEGKKTTIGTISFIGNKTYSDGKLKDIISTKESVWYRFFSSDDTYDPDRIAFDKELLRRFYVSKGYADFKVNSASAELTMDKDEFFITFSLEEGDRYHFGGISVESQLPDVEGSSLQALVESETGKVFNAEEIEQTIDKLTKHLGNMGYAFVKIDAKYDRDVEEDIIGINYVVKEGPRVYVENININGNVRTLDEVIRREFRVAEGDPYNANKLQRSQQRIRNLDFFNAVDIKTEQGSAPDKVIINADVEEKSTGELTFGAGFSSTDGALGDISISERNLLGKGQFLRLNLTVAAVRQEIDLSFTEPYFLDRDLATGFDLFKIKRDGDSSRSSRTFDLDSEGGVIRTSYPLTEYLRHSIRYSLRNDDITDVDSTASLFIRRQEGENTTSLVGHSLIYDRRDSRRNATEGYYIRFNQDIAGLGGDARFVRHELRGAYFVPVYGKDWILQIGGKAGNVFGYGGKDVRINDRFFVGGSEIRGFENDGIGPRDESSKDPLGGNTYATATVELGFPLGLPEELGLRGALFTDAGTLIETDDVDTIDPNTSLLSRVLDENSIRASFGVGIAWTSPVGPIRIDLAHAYQKEEFDETEVLRFNFGTRF